MTVRSTRLAAQQLAINAGAVVYTCPTGWRTIVKNIQYFLGGGTTGTFQVQLQLASGTESLQIVYNQNVTLVSNQWEGWIVLYPGDKLYAAATTQPVNTWISGTLLQLTGTEPI